MKTIVTVTVENEEQVQALAAVRARDSGLADEELAERGRYITQLINANTKLAADVEAERRKPRCWRCGGCGSVDAHIGDEPCTRQPCPACVNPRFVLPERGDMVVCVALPHADFICASQPVVGKNYRVDGLSSITKSAAVNNEPNGWLRVTEPAICFITERLVNYWPISCFAPAPENAA